MTCIVGVSDGARVAMAADSLAVDTNGTFMEVSKVLAFDGGVLLGVAGSSAAIPLLRRRLTPGAPVDDPAQKAGVPVIGIEKSERYCQMAAERCGAFVPGADSLFGLEETCS